MPDPKSDSTFVSIKLLTRQEIKAKLPNGVFRTAVYSWCFLLSLSIITLAYLSEVAEEKIMDGLLCKLVFVFAHIIVCFLFYITYRVNPGYIKPHQKLIESEDGQQLRFCTNCEIHQPLRTKHCNICDMCVVTFDHHCYWVG